MNKQFNTSDTVEGTSEDVNSSVVNSDRFDDHDPVLATLVQDTPVGASIANEETPYKVSEHETISHESTLDTNESALALLGSDESQQLRTRWSEIQAGFVDEPRTSVQQADALVSEVIEKLTQMFANEHGTLEGQ